MIVNYDVICVVEGEKCADALHSIGLPAVTSIGGSSAARSSDWTPLRGMRVLILPDIDTTEWMSETDAPGTRYARDVEEILTGLGCTVRIKYLPVRAGEDAFDFIEANKRRPRVWLRRMITQ